MMFFTFPKRTALLTAALLLCMLPHRTACADPTLQQSVLQSMQWRSVGPANMGGRISDIAVDPQNSYTWYIALATGGVLKTTNNGTTWQAVFDHEPVGSVGAVAIAPSNPKIVWVGTGEANGRNSSSWGDGVYKSTDGGQSWTHMGLNKTREIGRIVIDPKNPDIVYVAAAGDLWGYHKARGVYKTTDGGKTWQHVLNLGPETGAIDVALGPEGSHVVLAAAYSRLRTPWGYRSLNDRNGIYRSDNDGKTWTHITSGLPVQEVGRIGFNCSASKPGLVFAVVESDEGGARNLFDINSKFGGVFVSKNNGLTWKRRSNVAPRGFYFGQIRVDPLNPKNVYVLGFGLSISKDGGRHFKTPGYGSPGVHPDLHAMWIDPANPAHMLLGNDGGLYVTYDKAKTWQEINNFAAGEFYEVSVDNRQPYWIYGGLQDNSCWMGPSNSLSYPGISNRDWQDINGGDGFYAFADYADPNIVYSESQNGSITRWNRLTNQRRDLSAKAPEGYPDYRFNWNTPMLLSHYNHDMLYVGGSHLLAFTNHGRDWTQISPDLSKQIGPRISSNGSGAEVYGTIVCIAESSIKQGEIWCGTDDGNVQLTLDQGKTWTNLTDNLPAKVRNYWVTRIAASRYEPGTAYVSIDGHRSDDLAPYLFKTTDYGKTWRSITGDLPKHGPIQALQEDPVNPSMLFAGTEFGAYVTWDGGNHWSKLGDNLPTVAVDDLALQAEDHALVAGTHGRSIWVLDNIAPLEGLTAKTDAKLPLLFAVPPALEFIPSFTGRQGQGRFTAPNPPSGVQMVYWLPALVSSPPAFAISNSKGKVITTLYGTRYPGLHNISWDMRIQGGGGGPFGRRGSSRFTQPGEYTVTFTIGKVKQVHHFMIEGNPALSQKSTAEQRQDKH